LFKPAPFVSTTLHTADLPGLPLVHRGKVRDVFALDASRLLMVASDRLSAFDVVLPDPIPGKGEMLCRMSNVWFGRTEHLLANHLTGDLVAAALPVGVDPTLYLERSVVVKRLKPLPVEAIARGYLIGSGWKDYQASGQLCGISLPAGMRQAEMLAEPLFTPSSKAAAGDHDENIGFDSMVDRIGGALAEQIRDITLAVYRYAAAFAAERGVIIADTKLEFGLDDEGQLLIMDELLTPDSSRFWPADDYAVGVSPPSYDKQFVRDYLESLDWNKTAPGPRLPQSVVEGTQERYREAMRRLCDPAPQR
jgi:phosphoribosylaminoimidazole-succinocarboxamide synthase